MAAHSPVRHPHRAVLRLERDLTAREGKPRCKSLEPAHLGEPDDSEVILGEEKILHGVHNPDKPRRAEVEGA